jgi:hypothetical protein
MVRPYAVTGGRIRATARGLDMITLVVAVRPDSDGLLLPEHSRVLQLCNQPMSVAELAAATHLPVAVVKVLITDLIEDNYLIYRSPAVSETTLLRAVRDGIRKL